MRISLLLTKLDPSLDGPWIWKSSWNKDMPDFFHGKFLEHHLLSINVPDVLNPVTGLPNGVYDNIYQDLDDSPVTYHTTEVMTSF